jgi:hypothetical protein
MNKQKEVFFLQEHHLDKLGPTGGPNKFKRTSRIKLNNTRAVWKKPRSYLKDKL